MTVGGVGLFSPFPFNIFDRPSRGREAAESEPREARRAEARALRLAEERTLRRAEEGERRRAEGFERLEDRRRQIDLSQDREATRRAQRGSLIDFEA